MPNKIISAKSAKKKKSKASSKVALVLSCALTAVAAGGIYWYCLPKEPEFTEEKIQDFFTKGMYALDSLSPESSKKTILKEVAQNLMYREV